MPHLVKTAPRTTATPAAGPFKSGERVFGGSAVRCAGRDFCSATSGGLTRLGSKHPLGQLVHFLGV